MQGLARGLEGDAIVLVQEFVSHEGQHVRREVLEAHDQRSGRFHHDLLSVVFVNARR